ncbi:penicillin-binding protein [Candidatus Parcubacteria bacterium]|nr:MAG: penicillin-binding protein [Candidatus Parcubacteria bacterium]
MPIPGLSVKIQSPQNWKNGGHKSGGGRKKDSEDRKIHWFLKTVFTLLVGGLLLFSVATIGVLIWASKNLPNPDRIIQRDIALSTKIYDRTGKTVLYEIHGEEKRSLVNLNDIPDYMINATLTAEDRQFFEHKGFKLTSIIRAFIVDLTKGSKEQGASTLTQQLVKNAVLSPEKTYTRKIKEIILAYQIERKFTKEEILKMYFNEIPYGSTAYGVAAAAQSYFGKTPKDLTLGEAAVLTAMTKAPSYYSPYGTHQDELFARQRIILDGMVAEKFITAEEAETAKNEKIEFNKKQENIIAPHFVMYVKEYLAKKYGERAVEQGGLKVITTLDLYKQDIAEEAVKNGMEKVVNYGGSNAALVALDPKNGQILAMVGSKDFYDQEIDGQVNVTIRPRQPGSSFKPIVYTAAFIKGYTPDTVLFDVNTSFKTEIGKDYEPKNYDLKQHGPVTIRKALAGSLNIPAVKAIYLAGIDKVLDLANMLGYSTLGDRSRFGLSLVLGGGEVKLLEHTNAYASFAREGEWHPTAAILEVQDKEGNALEEWQKKEKKIIETQVARQINDILSDNESRTFIFGANNFLHFDNRPVAAKTGTTNDYRDAWTLGYTPSLAAGVWAGNNDNTEMKRGADGSVIAAPIWNEFMKRVLGDTTAEEFKKPDEIKTGKPVLDGQIQGKVTVKIDKVSGLLATEFTPKELIVEKTFTQAHNILHYVDKENPRGEAPADPASDWQYQNWEEAVRNWAGANNLTVEDLPTEYDNIHLPEYQPEIRIVNPGSGSKITSRNIDIEIVASAAKGVSKVEYYIENSLIGVSLSSPFSLNGYIGDPEIGDGFYNLTAIAFDQYGNKSSDTINLNMMLEEPLPLTINLTLPSNGQNVRIEEFPLAVSAELSSVNDVKEIIFYAEKQLTGQLQIIGNIRQITSPRVITSWLEVPEPEKYLLYAKAFDNLGRAFVSQKITITVTAVNTNE